MNASADTWGASPVGGAALPLSAAAKACHNNPCMYGAALTMCFRQLSWGDANYACKLAQ